jgi:Raf kinase inhibitor-like YbhB/YbcL family protein
MTTAGFQLYSTSFAAGDLIPARFTCDGEDTSPDLAWAGAPDGTAALVLVVDDPDADGFTHWIVYDMTGSETGALPLGVSASPDAPPQGTNDFGQIGWNGPCPPSGEHRYRFTLSALAAPLGLAGGPRAADVASALGGASVLGAAVLEARYRRG